jgi:FKBP-type peptidyl-prolyl cis-trans isomerase FkpA
MRTLAIACILALGQSALAAGPSPKTDEQKAFYTLGLEIGRSLGSFNPDKKELQQIEKGISDQLFGKPAIEIGPDSQKLIRDLATKRHEAMAKKNKVSADAFMAKTAKEKGAQKLANGILFFNEKEGTGATPKATDQVKVNYRGTLPNGTEFDSSYKRKQPAEFPLNRVIPCWTEGLQHVKVGGKAKLVCPPAQAYGENGRPGIPPNSPLVFEIELLDTHAASATQAPKFPPMPGSPAGKK